MYEDIKSLSVSYPLIGAYDDVAKNIVDAKIVITVSDLVKEEQATDIIEVAIVNIDDNEAIIKASLLQYGVVTLSIPVFIIDNNVLPDTSSYILIKHSIGSMSKTYPYVLHPDCLVVLQKAPSIYFGLRYDPKSEEEATEELIKLTDNIKIDSGYNVNVSGSSGSIYIEAEEGVGAGRFPNTPLIAENDKNHKYVAKGLISINGIGNDLTITATSKDIIIDTVTMGPDELVEYGDNVSMGVAINIEKVQEESKEDA